MLEDLDGDGKADIVCENAGTEILYILLDNLSIANEISSQKVATFSTAFNNWCKISGGDILAWSDVDGDGKIDAICYS